MADWDKVDMVHEKKEDKAAAPESNELLLARANKMKLREIQDILKAKKMAPTSNKKLWTNKKELVLLLKDILEQELSATAKQEKRDNARKFPPYDGTLEGKPLTTYKASVLKIYLTKRGYRAPRRMKQADLVDRLHKFLEEEYNRRMTTSNKELTFQQWKQESCQNKIHFHSDYETHRLMMQASRTGNLKEVTNLAGQGLDLNYQNEFMAETPLMAAAANGFDKIVKFLLERGARIDIVNKKGETALHQAALGFHQKCIDLLKSWWKIRRPELASMTRFPIRASHVGSDAYDSGDRMLALAIADRDAELELQRIAKVERQRVYHSKRRASLDASGGAGIMGSRRQPQSPMKPPVSPVRTPMSPLKLQPIASRYNAALGSAAPGSQLRKLAPQSHLPYLVASSSAPVVALREL